MNHTATSTKTASALTHTACLLLGLPFDLVRANYARAVRFGLIDNSLLKSARFERDLVKVEQQTLGLWARRV